MPNAELQRQNYTDAESGATAVRTVHVDAADETGALAIAEAEFGIFRGAVYQDTQGNEPDADLICDRLRVRQLTPTPPGEAGAWEVQGDYVYADGATLGQIPIPPGGATRWRVEAEEHWEEAVRDRFGNLITNTAGDLFANGPLVPRGRLTLVAEYIRQFADQPSAMATILPYVFKVNSQTFRGAPKHCFYLGRPDIIQITQPLAPIQPKFLFTLRFQYKAPQEPVEEVGTIGARDVGGWDYVVPNVGRRVRFNGDADHPIRELKNGYENDSSWGNLAGNWWDAKTPLGQAYRDAPLIGAPMFLTGLGDGVIFNPDNTEKYIVVEPIKEADFNAMGL